MLIKLYEENTSLKQLNMISECLSDGGIIIYPTDTVYGFGCSINKPRAIERIATLKGIKMKEHNFSLICANLSQLSNFVRPIPNHIFRVLNKTLPGPYTFILEANNQVPKLIYRKKKFIGIRIPNNQIALNIVENLRAPLLSSSVLHEDEIIEYRTDPELIYDKYKDTVDIVIDGGLGDNNPSTIVDCSSGNFEILRDGKGDTSIFN